VEAVLASIIYITEKMRKGYRKNKITEKITGKELHMKKPESSLWKGMNRE